MNKTLSGGPKGTSHLFRPRISQKSLLGSAISWACLNSVRVNEVVVMLINLTFDQARRKKVLERKKKMVDGWLCVMAAARNATLRGNSYQSGLVLSNVKILFS